jgi:hypothetical protein
MYDLIASITAARPQPYPIAATSSSSPLPLHCEKFGQPCRVRGDPVPCRAKLPHAVRTVLAGALRLSFFHRDCSVDAPGPAVELNADRADLDLVAIANDNPIIGRAPVDGSLCARTGPLAYFGLAFSPISTSRRTVSERVVSCARCPRDLFGSQKNCGKGEGRQAFHRTAGFRLNPSCRLRMIRRAGRWPQS